jgi:hypothetical protein
MKFRILDPEVAGGLGSRTRMDSSVHPPVVKRLHYELEGWLGDDLVQTFPCYLVTKKLQATLAAMHPTGLSFAAADVSAAEGFNDRNPGVALPELTWLKVHGAPGKDDFGLTADARLVVSDHILEQMQTAQLSHCDVVDFTG